MAFENLTEVTIRQNSNSQSYQRGAEYCRRGAVESLTQRGNTLLAVVEGSETYRVTATFAPDGFIEADCSCPFDYDGWCKHIVAALLTCLKSPGDIEEQPSLPELLAPLTREQLLALVLKLTERDPDLADNVAATVSIMAPQVSVGVDAEATGETPAVSPVPYRRKVRTLMRSLDHMRSSEAYWHIGSVVREVSQVADEARAFTEAGDGRNALIVLEAVTAAYLEEWESLDDSDGDASAFFNDVARVWAEALLIADLTPREREEWAEKLEDWQSGIEDYGVDDGFQIAVLAAHQGWEHPPLQKILQGQSKAAPHQVEFERVELEVEDVSWHETALMEVRLEILQRQKRFEEYLRLAAAVGLTRHFATMLVQLGRAQEAMAYGLRHFERVDESFALAQALQEQGSLELALQMAEHGLALPGVDAYYRGANGNLNRATLAIWLRDLATAQGQTLRALPAARIAVLECPALDAYLKVRDLVGATWSEERAALLGQLRQTQLYNPAGAIDIFLHEAANDEAFLDLALDKIKGSYDYDLVGRVVDATLNSRPQRVIPICREQAEAIMDKGQAGAYEQAALWLKRMRAAHLAAGQGEQWQSYLEPLIVKHQKKWKLRPLLEALRVHN